MFLKSESTEEHDVRDTPGPWPPSRSSSRRRPISSPRTSTRHTEEENAFAQIFDPEREQAYRAEVASIAAGWAEEVAPVAAATAANANANASR